MPIRPFLLERYFAEYEFKVEYLLSPSDCESLSMTELLGWASPASRLLWEDLKLGYTESSGHPLLREEISRLYEGLGPEQVLVAVPEEAIFIAMHTLLQPGDRVVTVFPAYQSLYEIARSIGCTLAPWKIEPGPSGWRLDLDRLEALLSEPTRLLVINFPHNPTGCLPSAADFAAILALARRGGIPVFSDEMYRLLEYDPARRLPAVCEVYEHGISLSGLSKSFALPGLRLGWLASQDRLLLERFQVFKDYTTICHSAPSEVLGIIALQAKERILARNLQIIARNLEFARDFCAADPDRFEWIPPQGGSVAFPRWLGQIPVEQFCQEALDRQGVMIVPGSIFDFPGGHFRIGLGRRNLPGALERVSAYLAGE